MRFKFLFVPVLFVGACMSLPFPGMSGRSQTQTQQSETSSSSTVMTKLDMSTSASGLRVAVKPEVKPGVTEGPGGST